jgi:EF-hand domain pair
MRPPVARDARSIQTISSCACGSSHFPNLNVYGDSSRSPPSCRSYALILEINANDDSIIDTKQLRTTALRNPSFVQVYALFLEIDANGDGIIDAKELRKGLRRFGYKLTDAEVEQLMLRMDLNHDGTVDFSELAASLIDWQAFQAVEARTLTIVCVNKSDIVLACVRQEGLNNMAHR